MLGRGRYSDGLTSLDRRSRALTLRLNQELVRGRRMRYLPPLVLTFRRTSAITGPPRHTWSVRLPA